MEVEFTFCHRWSAVAVVVLVKFHELLVKAFFSKWQVQIAFVGLIDSNWVAKNRNSPSQNF